MRFVCIPFLWVIAACSTAAPLGEPPTALPPMPGHGQSVSPVTKTVAPPPSVPVAVTPPPIVAPPAPRATFPVATHGIAVDFLAEVFEQPRITARVVGWIQTGRTVALGARLDAEKGRCSQGWYPLADGRGYVCGGRGVIAGVAARPTRRGTAIARLDDLVPYRYAYVHVEGGTPRYRRRPTPEERASHEALGATGIDGELVDGFLSHGFMISVKGLAGHGPDTFWSRLRGGYVSYEHAYTLRPRPFRGVDLGATGAQLPLAFVTAYGPYTWRAAGDTLRKIGEATRLEHVDASRPSTVGGVAVIPAADGAFYRAQDMSIAVRPGLPADLVAGEKWIHVSLEDQTLVALEGDRPVYATVVSTGLPTSARRTRAGTFRVKAKHVSVTMDDDEEGAAYSIEDVPWTMFYDRSFALHGAFWHERFGHPQSHGCVNLSAADAKWLFQWAGPTLPEGWYAMLATATDPGTRIVIE